MFLRDLFARIMALWALLSFAVSFLIILIPSMLCGLIPNPTGQDWFIRIARGWMRMWLLLVGCPPRVKGREHFKKGQSYVVICGMHMCIYPEGTRNRSQEPLKTFYDGAFKLSIDTGRPLLPAVLFHTRNILSPNRSFYFIPHPIELHFLEPIDPVGETVQSLKEKSFAIMSAYYTAHSA